MSTRSLTIAAVFAVAAGIAAIAESAGAGTAACARADSEPSAGAALRASATGAAPLERVYRGRRVDLALDPGCVLVRGSGVDARILDAAARALSAGAGARATVRALPRRGWAFIEGAAGGGATGVVSALAVPGVAFAAPVFRGSEGLRFAPLPGLLIGLAPGAPSLDEPELLARVPGARLVDPAVGGFAGMLRVEVPARDGFEVLAAANRLARDPRVAWAEPDMLVEGRHHAAPEPPRIALIPNDPGFADCWGIRNTGQFGGVPDMDMDGDLAWDITIGSPNVRVLVLDVGVEPDHPDLHQEPGADFTEDYWDGADGGPWNSCDNHGTPVAGCVSATIGNGTGTVGIAPGCPVISARIGVSAGDCSGTWFGSAAGLVYALGFGFQRGARASNNSNGLGYLSSAVDAAYASTRDGGMVHFASAGNGGQQPLPYPASIPEVMAVGAIQPTGALASFTNFGPEIEFMAPGVNVLTTDRTGSAGWVPGDYTYAAGTSFASPYAAGVAALIASQDTTRTAAEIEDLMKQGCRDLGVPGFDALFGWGLVNAHGSLVLGQSLAVGVGASGAPALRLAARPNPFAGSTELAFTLAAPGAVALDVLDAAGRRVRRLAAGGFAAGEHSVRWDGRDAAGRGAPAGLYFVRLDAAGSARIARVVHLGGHR
jgi:subtilisin family serine protease